MHLRKLFVVLLLGMFAAETGAIAAPEAAIATTVVADTTGDELLVIQRDITWLEQEIAARRKALRGASRDQVADQAGEIADLDARLQKARLNFIATATGVELPSFGGAKGSPPKRDLLQEAQQFIEPLFDAVKRVSEKPRRIEGYRSKLLELRGQLALVDRAASGLGHLVKARSYPAFEKRILSSLQELSHARDDLQIQADALERKLNGELADRRTVREVVTEQMRLFFSHKGKNLLTAFVVFNVVLWGLFRLKGFVLRARVLRKRAHLGKTITAAYGVLAALLATFAVLVTLHILNDWFLITAITLLLLATIWAMKAFLPVFVHEMRLVLSLGPVRQGERVTWAGVPWLVKSLGFSSVLVNEALQGGNIVLPASALIGLTSRALVPGEPWFPTKLGDTVKLEDGCEGRIEIQTVETVVLRMGKSRKYYATSAFLGRNPVVAPESSTP